MRGVLKVLLAAEKVKSGNPRLLLPDSYSGGRSIVQRSRYRGLEDS